MEMTDNPIILDIFFEDLENVEADLMEIFDGAEFKQKLKEETLSRVTVAIENKKKSFALFRLPIYGIDLKVEQSEYKKLLDKVLEKYQEEEDYLKCIEIKNLMDKL